MHVEIQLDKEGSQVVTIEEDVETEGIDFLKKSRSRCKKVSWNFREWR